MDAERRSRQRVDDLTDARSPAASVGRLIEHADGTLAGTFRGRPVLHGLCHENERTDDDDTG